MSGLAELIAAAAAFTDAFLRRLTRDHFIEDGLFAGLVSENSPQTLNVLARRARARKDDGDRGFGDVDAFVQDLRSREREHVTIIKSFEPFAPLFDAGLVRDRGD